MSLCLTQLCTRLNSLETRIYDLETGGGNFRFHVSAGTSPGDISGGFVTVEQDEQLNLWSPGGLSAVVTAGSARVEINPENLTENLAVAGQPLPPDDATRPAIHFANDGMYYWAPSTNSWALLASATGDNWGSQVVEHDGTLSGSGTLGSPLSVAQEDRHPETGTLFQPSIDGVVRIVEWDKLNNPTGDLVLVDLTGSADTHNGVQTSPNDGKNFVDDHYFRIVRNWTELEAAVAANTNVLIAEELTADANTSLDSDSTLYFVGAGFINTNGFTVEINCEIMNPQNKQIFTGWSIDETYPARWDGTGRDVSGSFGGNNQRDPRWWGMKTSITPEDEDLAFCTANSDAIAAAALSARIQNGPMAQLTVILPAGEIPIQRTVRLDGLRTRLMGQGCNATKLIGDNNNFDFDTTHFILTEDYPTNGITPMVEIGYEEQNPGPNQDQGFMGGVRELTLTCPDTQPNRRIGGIMWESALQEMTKLEFVTVENPGGYAFGGPRYQRNEHNDPTPVLGVYPQVNQLYINNVWMYGSVFDDTVAMSIFGVTFKVQNASVIHGGTGQPTGMTVPAIYTAARECGGWENIHIEDAPEADGKGIGIHSLADPNNAPDRMSFKDICYLPSAPVLGTTTEYRTLQLDSIRGSYSCTNICQAGAPDDLGGAYAIEDTVTGKLSTGWHTSTANGTAIASYFRQITEQRSQVSSSDPEMRLWGEKTYDPPAIAYGDNHTTTVTVSGARFGDTVIPTMDIDLVGITLTAYVSAANTVTVVYANHTGAPQDLGSGTLRATIVS